MAATLLATIPGGVSTTVVTNAGMVPVYFSGGQEPHSGTPSDTDCSMYSTMYRYRSF
jgi:hypothetical protein